MSTNKKFHLLGSNNVSASGEPRITGKLNIYTMETGDGRELELTVLDGYVCWRRVNDVNWTPLVSLSDLSPKKGIDYWTDEDFQEILGYVNANIGNDIFHHNLLGRDEEDQHPVTAITGLKEILDSIQSDKSYIHKQSSASTTWHIVHNLNKYPSVTVVDSAKTVMVGEIVYIDMNSLDIKFSSPFSGKAYMN